VSGWPEITEPLLRERQAMSDEEFFEFLAALLARVEPRELDDYHYEQAITYPWDRHVADVAPDLARIDGARIPLLAYGANASLERLALKFAHLPEGHRTPLIRSAELTGFDVGATAQPPLFLTMPATLVPSPGTSVHVAVLFADPVQFTALWWTELSYRVGALDRVELRLADGTLDRALVFISRYGAFCVDGEPVVLKAIEARDRRFRALTQEQILDAAGRMTIGGGARDLLATAYANPAAFFAEHQAAFKKASLAFASPQWTPMPHAAPPADGT
jgi:hypothetical protein